MIAKELNIVANIKIVDYKDYILPENSIITNILIKRLGIVREGYTERLVKKYVNG